MTSIASDPATPLFALELRVPAHDLQDHWRRCNMLANYVAEYLSYQFPEREWAENLISTITNEFLEAVAALSPGPAELLLRCHQLSDALQIDLDHGLRPELAQPYASFLAALDGAEVDQLYFELMTAPERPPLGFNQFGLTMLVHDFGARVSAQLAPGAERILVRVAVPTSEIAA